MKRFIYLTLPSSALCAFIGCGGSGARESGGTGAADGMGGGSESASSSSASSTSGFSSSATSGSSSGGGSGGASTASSGAGGGSGGASTSSTSGASSSSGSTSSSGASSSSGSTSSSSSSSSTSAGSSSSSGGVTTEICNFASGLNVAWVDFANDVPNPNVATFQTIFQNTHAAGGRVVRWWFHTNGTVTPGYQANGMVQNLPQSHINGVKSILDTAHAAGVAINISLWSFDMLQANAGSTYVQNEALLTQDSVRQSYIDNYLTPLVTALKGYPGLYSYEIFNEPEGMTPSGWATYRVAESYIQRTVNWLAAAIHTADPSALVTNGSQVFQYCSNVAGNSNYYSDSALKAAGGKANGTLDFYEVHYYESNGTANSCFLHPASYWGLDKKLVMGEFYAATTDGVAQDSTYTYLYNNGYNGAWAWSYESDMPWPSMQTPMQDLYSAQTATVGTCP
jgi:Cellulase (glycosyl hydrolase family 5)